MRIYEFNQDSATVSKIIALANQLKQELDQGNNPNEFSTDDLLDYFQQSDVILDRNDLYNLIKVQPLKSVIRNIQGDAVVFKGQDEPGEAPKDQQQQVVANMATSAMNSAP